MRLTRLFNIIITSLSLLLAQATVFADELVHYDNKGRALNQYQCDKVNVHKSSQQDTLVCKRKAKVSIQSLSMQAIRSADDVRRCKQDQNCVVIDNQSDPHWIPVALTGIPDAVFGQPDCSHSSSFQPRE